jgi:hypothetical protein
MRVFLACYADGRRVHLWNQKALVRSARGNGIDVVRAYHRHDLPEDFRRAHRHILDQARGAGYWLWKPWVIQDCLRRADPGDLVVYLDAGILIRQPLHGLIEQACRSQLVLFKNSTRNADYVKRDCFVLTGTDDPDCHAAHQIDASTMLILNTEANHRFVGTWLDYCADERILTDGPNQCGLPNLPGHIAHRRDQAVLSVLAWRESTRLQHVVLAPARKHEVLFHHRRRRARVPIVLWNYRPRLRRWLRERLERWRVPVAPERP